MLSNDQCKIYLDSLLQSCLIQEVDSGNKMVYRITQKGNRFLSYYDQMKELLPVGVEENVAEEVPTILVLTLSKLEIQVSGLDILQICQSQLRKDAFQVSQNAALRCH